VQAHDEQLGDGRGPAVDSRSTSGGTGDALDGAAVQQVFPALWRHVRPTSVDEFAHQAERDFSAILDYYRVRWAYEPTSFPLVWGEDGRPAEMFTPDFYLPDHRLYIEMTTMRQSLVTRKNRKLRRLRELYPDIRIKLLYRRDYLQLVDVFLRPLIGDRDDRPGKVVFDTETIAIRLDELAAEIAAAESDEEHGPLVVLVASDGAERFAAELRTRLTVLGVATDWDVVRLSRARVDYRRGRARLREKPKLTLANRRVLLLTDVVSTGLSMDFLMRWLVRQQVRATAIGTLLDRPEARITPVPVKFAAFGAPNELVVGYGLHLRRRFADLDYVATLTNPSKVG
jgi:hypoxanthine phosphoribosyltransferase